MKFIKYFSLIIVIASLTSCLKSKNDLAGLRNDPGEVLTAITEKQYQNTDAQNLGCGFQIYANFDFTTLPNEKVKFLTLHVAQPRATKIVGAMQVKLHLDNSVPFNNGYDTLPGGSIDTDPIITIPAFTGVSEDVPVKLAVDKTLLDVNADYSVHFDIVSVSQGVISTLDNGVDVNINQEGSYNESIHAGGYVLTSTVHDDANQYTITNNTKQVFLQEDNPDEVSEADVLIWSCAGSPSAYYLYANNTVTGANTALFAPVYVFDAAGNVIDVSNSSGSAAVSNIVVDAVNSLPFVYVDNDHRSFTAKYSFTLTSTINGVVTPRNVTVTEAFKYNTAPQAFYF